MDFQSAIEKIETILKLTKICVIATSSADGVVAASQVCLVSDGLDVYFQTDKSFEKIENIKSNPHVAINCGAYYFKGVAEIVGAPSTRPTFIDIMKEKHPSSYLQYTNLKSEVLVKIKLTEARIWGQKCDDEEYILVVDLNNKTLKKIVCDKIKKPQKLVKKS